MDRKRMARLQRIVKVQRQQEETIRYEISVANADIHALEERAEDLTSQWGSHEGPLGEVVNQTIARKLKRAAAEKTRKQARVKQLTDQLLGEKRKTTMAEKQHKEAKTDHDRNAERKSLMEVAELQVLKQRSGRDKPR
ncbi:hypothetical protein [Pseudovibrio exalbescens]|uniref:hypothetical protein n=1 Tax=Pseudovibrio exalbescens TaxID=197461 RepID=UPI0011AF4985|nr:hypothetical protein [Pseudovibrio exalbescens]